MNKILSIVVTIIILGGIGYFVYQYLYTPRVISTASEQITSCIDPDGNNIYEKGETAYVYPVENTNRTSTDMCDYFNKTVNSNVGILRETYCSEGYLVTDMVNCGLGSVCRNGACVKGPKTLPVCNDSDGGISPKTRGEITSLSVTGATDDCLISKDINDYEGRTTECSGPNCYVYEHYCKDDADAYQLIPSPNGCENGVQK